MLNTPEIKSLKIAQNLVKAKQRNATNFFAKAGVHCTKDKKMVAQFF